MATRSQSSAREELLGMLIEDHKRVKKAHRDFEKLDPESDREARTAIVERTCAELEVHAQLEEELLYPAARTKVAEDNLIDEAEVEHQSAKQLIAQIKTMNPDDPKYSASFTVLCEYVKHHVREEEGELFPQLGRSRLDWIGMLETMVSRRRELMTEMGLLDESLVADAMEDLEKNVKTPAARRSGRAAGSTGNP
ncbi:Hemerythrin HHE cation binding domain [Gulbenkiania indica]|uniref:Hemerythrin HHE cation binding domain n=1 Tax=Gulbenkiania indica TaxID=375574 RepID=A0A0K6GUK1_9NEIS|nr:hemerythrin domain-containing protein [Gulbenkiania indica]CUA82219.1 Hemerythrin HHE cation binding domain [Gulbenkiania indica]